VPKLKTKDQDENDTKLWGWYWVWQGSNCMNLKVWEAITGAIKSNWKNRD